jgi:hypothetical protein
VPRLLHCGGSVPRRGHIDDVGCSYYQSTDNCETHPIGMKGMFCSAPCVKHMFTLLWKFYCDISADLRTMVQCKNGYITEKAPTLVGMHATHFAKPHVDSVYALECE